MPLEEVIEKTAVELLRLAVTELPPDVMRALEEAARRETNPLAKATLETLIRNAKLAKEHRVPICQDTGTIIWYVRLGENFPIRAKLAEILRRATARATREVPLRPNAVDVVSEKNTGDNTGRFAPAIFWDVVPGDELELTVMPKGGGSENWCRLYLIKPVEGIKGVIRCVLRTVAEAMGQPCPPVIVGVGLASTSDVAMKLAKLALLRPLDAPHPIPEVAELERKLTELINRLGVGPMGLGGDTTCLGVKIEVGCRHPASYPVGVAIQCWAARRASARITSRGEVEITSHRV